MIRKLLRSTWTHLQIAFSDNYTVEGFEKTNKKFELPANLIELDSARKRQLTICNLFANQNLSIFEIVRILDTSMHQVVPTLIEQGLIKERRRNVRQRGPGHSTLSILPHGATANQNTAEPEQGTNAVGSSEVPSDASHSVASLSHSGNRMVS